MTAKVRGQSLSGNFTLLYLSAAFLILGVQRQAAASVSVETTAVTNKALPEMVMPPLSSPKLPPLGAPSLYLPLEEPSPASSPLDARLVIKLSERRVYLYRDNQLKASYPIAVGRTGWETPKGSFKVLQMLRNPSWEHPWTGKVIPPGAENPLGARWIGFWTDGKNFIGFHGTPQEQLVGQAVSHGCIRMRNQDILSLFAQVNIGTPVAVEP